MSAVFRLFVRFTEGNFAMLATALCATSFFYSATTVRNEQPIIIGLFRHSLLIGFIYLPFGQNSHCWIVSWFQRCRRKKSEILGNFAFGEKLETGFHLR